MTDDVPHLGAIYQAVVQDIAFFKRQQWVTTNYVVLVYAVIFAIEDRFPIGGWAFTLWAIALVAWLTGHWILCTGHQSIGKGRRRLGKLKKLLPTNVREIMEDTQTTPDEEKKNPMTWVFMAVQTVGIGLITVMLFTPSGLTK